MTTRHPLISTTNSARALALMAILGACADKGGEPKTTATQNKNTVVAQSADNIAKTPAPKPARDGWINIPAQQGDSPQEKKRPAFAMAQHETTVAQYKECVAAGECVEPKGADDQANALCNYFRGDDYSKHPMNCVTWREAKQFCEWKGARLPTADEWERAATHDGAQPRKAIFPWGDHAPDHCQNACFEIVTRKESFYCYERQKVDFYNGTVAVGMYSPAGDSPLGLKHMADNVREWTATPQSPLHTKEENALYIIKGGACYIGAEYLPVAIRDAYPANTKGSSVGFRCVK